MHVHSVDIIHDSSNWCGLNAINIGLCPNCHLYDDLFLSTMDFTSNHWIVQTLCLQISSIFILDIHQMSHVSFLFLVASEKIIFYDLRLRYPLM